MLQGLALAFARQRPRQGGAVLASQADYAAAYRLLRRPAALLVDEGLPQTARRLWEALRGSADTFTADEAARAANMAGSTAREALRRLAAAGLAEHAEPPRGQRAAVWQLTGRQPTERTVLPSPSELMLESPPSTNQQQQEVRK
jgi:hypothetical protein